MPDAVKSGHAALIVYAANEEQTTLTQAIIEDSLIDQNQAGKID